MAGTRNVATSNFKRFEIGEDVKIERGKNKGTLGTCVGFDEETGKVEIELANGNTIFAANGTVNWNRNEFYDPEQFDVELDGTLDELEFTEEQMDAIIESTTDEEPPVEKKAQTPRKEPKPCQCHCGFLASKGKMFLPGHDQRHKGNLIRAMQEGSEEAELELSPRPGGRGWRTESEIMELKSKASGRSQSASELAAMLDD